MISENPLNDLFSQLPSDRDAEYTVQLKRLVIDHNLALDLDSLKAYVEKTDNPYCFAAFYSLLIVSRQQNNYSEYNHFVDCYSSRFTEYPLNKIIQSTYFRNKEILGEKGNMRRAIKYAEEACTVMPHNLAVMHHYSELIALAAEDETYTDKSAIEKALERLDCVILSNPRHAKYYCTRGRLLVALGKYEIGIVAIQQALDLEKKTDCDALIRIGQYNSYLLQAKMRAENHKIDQKIGSFDSVFSKVKNDLDSTKTQYLEYLAFFSSVIAFIISAVNIVGRVDTFDMCAGVLVMLSGLLVVVFSTFRILLNYEQKLRYGVIKLIVCFGLGFSLLILGYCMGKGAISLI